MSDVNMAGCCVICDKPIFEVAAVYPADSALRGRPRVLAAALPGLRVVTIKLRNGSYTQVTACQACTESDFPLDLVWRKLLRTWKEEMSPEYRLAVGARPLSAAQVDMQTTWLAGQAENFPTAVMGIAEGGDHG